MTTKSPRTTRHKSRTKRTPLKNKKPCRNGTQSAPISGEQNQDFQQVLDYLKMLNNRMDNLESIVTKLDGIIAE